ncbi:MAG TPA: ATP-binding protein [Chryseosolibacter sp.]
MEIKKVAIIGPECTGKSDLSKYLAGEFNTVWVEEYARRYIRDLARPYGPDDLPIIAKGQLSLEDSMVPRANRVIFCDTDLYVVKVWSTFKYGFCDPKILDAIASRRYDLYLLTYIDIPWISDPQREHPDQREELYSIYLEEMKNQPVPYVEIKGEREARRKLAKESVQKLLSDII